KLDRKTDLYAYFMVLSIPSCGITESVFAVFRGFTPFWLTPFSVMKCLGVVFRFMPTASENLKTNKANQPPNPPSAAVV
ncbi:MAG: hypothetical protein QXS50_01250, partial [Candidatus Caldarchaeum sp.]